MAKKILYIVVGALLVFGLLFLLWSWFSSSGSSTTQYGAFGTASSTQGSLTSGGSNTNGETSLGSNTANGTVPLGNNAGAGGTYSTSGTSANAGVGAQLGGSSVTLATLGVGSVSGVDWLAGSGSTFNPSSINQLNSGQTGAIPTIETGVTGGSGSQGLSLGETLAATAIAGSLSCAIQAGIVALWPTGGGSAVAAGVTAAAAYNAALVPLTPAITGPQGLYTKDLGNVTYDLFSLHTNATIIGLQTAQVGFQATQAANNTLTAGQKFTNCITNTIAKAALDTITISTVNWINSGFNGSPSFVTNYQQFFTNVGDLAAGQFIQGAGLAFLCSPFAPQIKIAIAQAYANRGAQSCTLTKVVTNINNFMNGNFAAGGWPGLVSFTTVPTNNPYGAFAYAQVGLASAQSAAAANAQNQISPTGFLNLQKQSCPGQTPTISPIGGIAVNAAQLSQANTSHAFCQQGCNCSVVTPGGAIASSLNLAEGLGPTQLALANDLDQIINALTTQLLTRTLQNGLTSLSQPASAYQTPQDLAAQTQAQSLLADMENNLTYAQQLGSVDQGSISDIQTAQSNVGTLQSCWSAVASSTSSSAPQAATSVAAAAAQIQSLQTQVDGFNDDITNVNNEITELNQFITQISSVSSDSDVQTVATNYAAAEPFISATDVTTAQQNRTTLQAELASTNASTQSGLAQCQATPSS